MTWYKIASPIDNEMPMEYFNLISDALLIRSKLGSPSDFVILEAYGLKNTIDESKALLYFSPVAASHCMELLKPFNAAPSIPPALSDESLRVRLGDDDAARDLLKKASKS